MAQKLSKLVKDLHRNIHIKFHSNALSGSQEEDSWNIPLYIDLILYGDDVMVFDFFSEHLFLSRAHWCLCASRSIFLTVCFETFWLVDSCFSLGMLFKFFVKHHTKRISGVHIIFWNACMHPSTREKCPKFLIKSSHISEQYSITC